MAFENGNGMTPADMAAVMGNGNNNGWGNDNGAWWIVILFLFCFMGGNGWNNGGWNNGGAPLAAAVTQADMQRGFDQNATQGTLAGLQAQAGNGFSDAAVARCNAQANLLQQLNNNQMGLYQTLNANQSQTNQGMNAVVLGMQQMGSQNQAGIADLKYTVAQENCNDRQTLNLGLRDLMAQNTANTNAIVQSQQSGFQGIQDKLCQMEIDNLKTTNEQLRTQLNMANLAASQTQQTAQILQDNNAQTAALIQRIAPAPIPAYGVPNPNGSAFPGSYV